MALPADFPQPPADRESLRAALAWMFQVLSWVIARAAAGDQWWIGTNAAPAGELSLPAFHPDHGRPCEIEPTAPKAGQGGASRGEARPVRVAPRLPEAELPQSQAQFPEAGPPPPPPQLHRSAPHRFAPHRLAPRATIGDASRPARHPWPTIGPPLFSPVERGRLRTLILLRYRNNIR
jgi:hypothetical protein